MRGSSLLWAGLLVACGGHLTAPDDAATADAGLDAPDASHEAGFECDCQPLPPWGWRYVAYTPFSSQAKCPPGWEAPTDLLEVTGGGTPTCGCSCGAATNPQCDVLTVAFYVASTCTTVPSTFSWFPSCSPASLSATGSSLSAAAYANAFPTSATCAPPVVSISIPPLVQSPARECSPAHFFGGCDAGLACLPPKPEALPSGFSLCIETDDETSVPSPCPADFPVAHDAAESAVDTRQCGLCSCYASVQCGGSVTVYSDGSCQNAVTTLPLAKCTSLGTSGFAFDSFRTDVTPTATCNVANPGPTGGVTWTSRRRICCK